jgi:hypothetical protein
MNKYIVVVLMLLFSIFASAQTDTNCGIRKQLVVIPKSQPINFEFFVGDGKTITSQKFVVDQGLSESSQENGLEYVLKISQGGNSVKLIYQIDNKKVEKVVGRYEYRTVGDGACAQTRSISEWRFIKTSS